MNTTERLRVEGGYLYFRQGYPSGNGEYAMTMCFVPDVAKDD